jgi:branched-chain amino acid transport system substrate-binding protein
MKKQLFAAVAAVGLMLAPSVQAESVKIGFINTFSGGLAIFGKHQKDALELALDHLGRKLGGKDVEMVYGDDQAKPDVGRQVAVQMLQKDKVDFVTGIIWSNVLAAVQNVVLKDGKFMITTNAGWSQMAGKGCHPLFFSTSWNNDQTPEAMGKLMTDEGIDNVFLLSVNYQAGKDMLQGFERYYKGNKAGRILVKLGQTDYQAEISQIRAAKPKAIFAFLPGGMGVAFMKQYRAAGMETPFYSAFTIDHLSLPGHGKNAIGTYHTNFWDLESKEPHNQRFVTEFIKKYGYHPSSYAAQAYDLPFMLDDAIKAVGGDLTNKKGMMQQMEKAAFPTVRGKFSYNINHIPIQNYYKREVIADADGNPKIVARGVVFENHKDVYYPKCQMAKLKKRMKLD